MCLFGDIQTACNPATPVSGWEPYNTAKTVNLTECTPPGNCQASRDVKVAFADNAGNKVGEVLATEIKDTVALDQIPPSATSVVIKGYVKDTSGADTESQTLTYKSEVKLVLGATGATKVALSNTPIGSCAGASYSDATFSGTPPKYTVDSYLLQSGTGNKTVYACFKDDAGNSAGPATAFIYLDQNGPFNVSLGINRGAVYTSSTGVQLDSIAAQDDYQGGQIYMMISNCPDFGSATGCNTTVWLNLASNYPPTGYWALNNGTNESKRVYLKTRDAAGNESATASSSIILDTAKPSDLSIAIKQKPTKNTQVDLVIGATGADRMCLYGNMQSPCDPASKPETWERFRGDKVITLTGGEGTKTIYLVCADDAGNKTDYLPNNTVYDQTTYDITPPNNPQLQINSGNPYTLNQQVTLTMSADGSPYEYWVEGDVMSSAMSAGAFAWLPYTPSAQVNLQKVPARR
jgi:hypothetical protein